MTKEDIEILQRENDITEIQDLINSGEAWLMDGKTGRRAMSLLSIGACYLPLVDYEDYWGNVIPGRTKVKPGSTGSLKNSKQFWSNKDLYTAYLSGSEEIWGEYIMRKYKNQ